jgi:hypothetical protein
VLSKCLALNVNTWLFRINPGTYIERFVWNTVCTIVESNKLLRWRTYQGSNNLIFKTWVMKPERKGNWLRSQSKSYSLGLRLGYVLSQNYIRKYQNRKYFFTKQNLSFLRRMKISLWYMLSAWALFSFQNHKHAMHQCFL